MADSINQKWWPDVWSAMSPVDDLDDTRSIQRRRWEDQYSPPPSHKVQVPLSVIVTLSIYLVGQLVGGIWWAATLQSDVKYQQQDSMKLWQKVETHDLQLARMEVLIRTSVKEALADAGIEHNRPRQ